MFIAEQKKRENIAEYLLYMWQLEDILRAYEFDIDKIQKALIDPTSYSEKEKEEARQWYVQIIEKMQAERIEKEGHLSANNVLLSELNLLHLQLLKNAEESKYIETYHKTLPFIVELKEKSKQSEVSEIETCFTALYGYLLLKLQKRKISTDTASAISQISNLLRSLSREFNLQANKGE